MRHTHPRGHPVGYAGYLWCPACIQGGITTAEEILYQPPPRRGKIKVGMTVSWLERNPNPTGLVDPGRTLMTGQVWSLAGPNNTGLTFWWVVTPDQKSYHVLQDRLQIVAKGQASVHTV